MINIKPVPNWRAVATRAWSQWMFYLSAATGIVQTVAPILPPQYTVPLMTGFAVVGGVSRVIDQHLAQR